MAAQYPIATAEFIRKCKATLKAKWTLIKGSSVVSSEKEGKLSIQQLLRDKTYGHEKCDNFLATGAAILETNDRDQLNLELCEMVHLIRSIKQEWLSHEHDNRYRCTRFVY